jgi:subtilisin family serine protease
MDQPVNSDIADCGGYDGHGTHNASYAVGSRYGVAKGATIHVAKASGGSRCESDPASVMHAVNYIKNTYPPKGVVSISFGWGPPNDITGLVNAIKNAMDLGFVFTLAAACSNIDTTWSGVTVEPNGSRRALIVAGTDEHLTSLMPEGVDYGPNLSLFAPGAHVLGASVGGGASVQKPLHDSSCSDSFAAPHTAGVAALYLETHPGATPRQVHDAIVGAALVDVVGGSIGTARNRLLRATY